MLKFSSVSSFFFIKYLIVRLVLGAETLYHIRARLEGQTSTKFTFKFPLRWTMAELERRKSDCNDNPSGSNDCLLLQRRANKHHHREPTTHQPKKNDQIVTRIANIKCDEIEHLRAELESETKNRWVVSGENKNIFSAHRRWRNSRLLALSAVSAGNQCGDSWGERNCGTVSFSLRRVMIIWNSSVVPRGRKL